MTAATPADRALRRPLPEATMEACLQRWQGRCVDFREFAIALAMASLVDGTALNCIIETAVLPTSPARLFTGVSGACVSFSTIDEFIPKQDGGASWLVDGAREAMTQRAGRWARCHLHERVPLLGSIPDGHDLARQAAVLPHLRRTLDAVAALEKGGLDDAARDPEVIAWGHQFKPLFQDLSEAGDQPGLTSLLADDAVIWKAAVRRARLRVMPLLDNQRLLFL